MGRYDNIKDEATFKKEYKRLSKKDLIKFLSDANMIDEGDINTKTATKPELIKFVKKLSNFRQKTKSCRKFDIFLTNFINFL